MGTGATALVGIIMQVLGMGQSIAGTSMSYRMQQQAMKQQEQRQLAQNVRCPDGSQPVSVTIGADGSRTIQCR
jgi:hypothetical protein